MKRVRTSNHSGRGRRGWPESVGLALCAALFAVSLDAQTSGNAVTPLPAEGAANGAAPSGTGADGESLDPSTMWTSGRYRLTPSDVVELRFPYVPEFDQTVTIQPDGFISLKAVGDIRVQGRTLPQLREMLLESYEDILREPVINIILKEFEKPYFIIAGEVLHPGKFELRGATTLTQALVLAGGQTGAAKFSQVLLFRRFAAEWLEVKEINVKKMFASRDLSEDPLLRPGDTILVPKRILAKIAPFIPRPGLGLVLDPLSLGK